MQDGSRSIHRSSMNVLRHARKQQVLPKSRDVFVIEAPISSESFIVAQSFKILSVLEINSSESLDGSSSLFGNQLEAFSTDDLSLIRLMQAFLGGALLNAQQEEIPLP
jgi:hypothetical protein